MAKQLASIRQVAGIKKANFLAIPRRAELRSIRAAADKSLEPYSMSFVNVKPHQGALGKKIWMYKPRSFEKVPPLSNCHLIAGVFNAESCWVPVNNTSSETVLVKAGTHLGTATELTEYDIPTPDDWDLDIDCIEGTGEETDKKSVDPAAAPLPQPPEAEENLSPKEVATRDFNKGLERYDDDFKELLTEFKCLFIPDEDFKHVHT